MFFALTAAENKQQCWVRFIWAIDRSNWQLVRIVKESVSLLQKESIPTKCSCFTLEFTCKYMIYPHVLSQVQSICAISFIFPALSYFLYMNWHSIQTCKTLLSNKYLLFCLLHHCGDIHIIFNDCSKRSLGVFVALLLQGESGTGICRCNGRVHCNWSGYKRSHEWTSVCDMELHVGKSMHIVMIIHLKYRTHNCKVLKACSYIRIATVIILGKAN